MRSNCLFFALALWRRRAKRGRRRYLAMRRSLWGPFPHFAYAERLRSGRVRFIGFVPLNPRRKTVPPLLFKGRVRWGD